MQRCSPGGQVEILNGCSWVRNGLLDITLNLEGDCSDDPGCSGGVRLFGENTPNDGDLRGSHVWDTGFHDGYQGVGWSARRR